MPKKNHQKVSSAKEPLSGLLGGRSPSSPIAPSAARGRNEVLSSTALPHLAEVAAGAKLRSRGTLRRPRDVDHHPGHGGLHPGEHHSNRTHSQRREKTDLPQAPKPEAFEFIPGPKLRAKLGISAVTLWRWRHDREKGFPAPKVINAGSILPWALLWLGSLGRRTGHERGSESLRNCPGKRSTLAASLSAARPRSRTAISC